MTLEPKNKFCHFPLFPHLFTMKWWGQMPWSSFFEGWVLNQFFTLLFHFHQKTFQFLFAFCHKGGVICMSEVIDISPYSRDSSLHFIQPGILNDVLCEAGWQDTDLTYSFPNLEPVFCSTSGSNCCFLACIQISQDAGKVVWTSLEEFSTVCCELHSQRLWCN